MSEPIMFSLTDITGRKSQDERVTTLGGLGQVRRKNAMKGAFAFLAVLPGLFILPAFFGTWSFFIMFGVWCVFYLVLTREAKDGIGGSAVSAIRARARQKPGQVYQCGVPVDPDLSITGVLGQGSTWKPSKVHHQFVRRSR